MLEYCKIVLNGVHEDKKLFRKELIKSMSWLNTDEQTQFAAWVREKFNHQHSEIIDEILNTKYSFAS